MLGWPVVKDLKWRRELKCLSHRMSAHASAHRVKLCLIGVDHLSPNVNADECVRRSHFAPFHGAENR